jgi:hypothetical protein
MLIPYGADNWPVARIAELAAMPAPGLPMAQVRPGAMLRINSGGLDLPPPPPTDAEVPVAERIAAHLKRLSGAWNRPAALFVDRYFAFLQDQIDAHRAELEARLAPFDGLFRPDDFIYSAPLPLPQAYLPAPAPDYVKVDFAFWLGARMVAVLLAPSPLTPMAERRRRERLAAAGIEIADARAGDLTGMWFAQRLGAKGSHFWEGETLPAAPFSAKLFDL